MTVLEPTRRDAARGLGALLAPRGVVVVGASRDPDKLGGAMARSLAGFPGPVALVNPRGGEGMHPTVQAAVEAIVADGGHADLAVLCVPAPASPAVIVECGRLGIGAALVCAGGFAETGAEGAQVQDRLQRAARQWGVRLLGPNTSGFFVPGTGLCASFVPGVSRIEVGSVAVVAASGGLNHSLAFAFQRAGIGLSLGVGIGAGIDVSAVDLLRHLGDDPTTTAIALHLETVTDGPALLEAVAAVSDSTPVVALVVGRHDVGDFARSHTGALATSWRTTRALLAQAGAVLVERADDLVTATSTLAALRLPRGARGVALMTAQAGPGLVIADALQEAGVATPPLAGRTRERLAQLLPPLTFQANPVDTGRPGPDHGAVLEAVAADPAIDVVALYGLLEPVVDLAAVVGPVASAGRAVVVGVDGTDDQVRGAVQGLRQRAVPVVVGPQALACAVAALVQDSNPRGRALPGSPPTLRAPSLGPGPWDEAAAKDLLDEIGIRTPDRWVCRDRAGAHTAFEELAGTVVVKICDARVLHKSDVGGVQTGVASHEELDEALDRMAHLGAPAVLLERMADPGVDLILGARRDPVFGPLVLLGVGGLTAEIDGDVAIAAAGAPRDVLLALPDQLDRRALLEGFRGLPVVDRHELADVVERLGALLRSNDHLTDVEVNPLRATRDGLVALDAVIVARGEEDGRGAAHQ